MIGSTLSRMAAAEKLSIPQLQQAIQNGTLPAYVGIPILQDKVKMEQQAKAAAAGAQQGGQRPTVADQVMQQASAEEAQQPAGIERLPVEAPAMAGGGIVAFADGGDTDSMSAEDYADYMQEAEDDEDDARQAGLLRKISMMGSPEASGMSYKDVSGGQLAAGKKAGAYKGITGDHKYSDLIRSEANKVGLDPEYALKIAMIESGGLKNPETARSKAGAIGIMQLMPATAKGLGVDPTIPEENVRGGVSMLKRLVDKYGDYQLAGAAYNAGEGRVDRALRSGNLAGLPGETQGYMGKIRGMKDGGIAHFDGSADSLVPEDDLSWEERKAMWKENMGIGSQLPPEKRMWASDIKANPALAAQPTQSVDRKAKEAQMQADVDKELSALKSAPSANLTASKPAATTTTTPPTTTPPTTTQPEPKASIYDRYIEQLMANEGKRGEQAEQDKWMGLLTAGLGMMGGTSPYAAANIGQGAMAGVSNYAALRKQAAAQEAADTKNMLLAQKYKESGELARQAQAATEAYRQQEFGAKKTTQETIALDKAVDNYKDYVKNVQTYLKDKYPTGALGKGYQEEYNALMYGPEAQEYARRAQMPIRAPMPTQGTPGWSATVK